MELVCDYPLPIVFDGGLIVCVPTTVTLQVDPDETVQDTDYYISAVYIEGRMQIKSTMMNHADDHRIPDSDPMSEVIRTWAYRTHKAQLDELWQTYLSDKPRKRRA